MQVGKSYSSAREAIIMTGGFLLKQLQGLDTAAGGKATFTYGATPFVSPTFSPPSHPRSFSLPTHHISFCLRTHHISFCLPAHQSDEIADSECNTI